jgi:hypothetical protein
VKAERASPVGTAAGRRSVSSRLLGSPRLFVLGYEFPYCREQFFRNRNDALR